MLIGYAGVSSNEQDTAAQVAALKAAKCERIYREQASGAGTGSNCSGCWISYARAMCWWCGNSTGSRAHCGTCWPLWSAWPRPKPGSAV
jgi:predicted amidophosphoribosyltransferase